MKLRGLHDLNSARREITERYLLHCHEIFAICNISRAITDAGVQTVINLAKRAQLSVGIICTKSDVRDFPVFLFIRDGLTSKGCECARVASRLPGRQNRYHTATHGLRGQG